MLSVEGQGKLKRSLVKHEGCRKFPYVDTKGKITVGIGYNVSDRGMSEIWIEQQYEEDVSYFQKELSKFPWFIKLNDDRKIVLMDMAFMGLQRFLNFKRMINAIEENDFKTAALEMLNSDWAKEVKNRALDLAQGMSTGIYQI